MKNKLYHLYNKDSFMKEVIETVKIYVEEFFDSVEISWDIDEKNEKYRANVIVIDFDGQKQSVPICVNYDYPKRLAIDSKLKLENAKKENERLTKEIQLRIKNESIRF